MNEIIHYVTIANERADGRGDYGVVYKCFNLFCGVWTVYNSDIDFSHSMIVEAASTQINMVANGNGTGAISELMLATIPNKLVIGEVKPIMEMDISLIAHDFSELSTAAQRMSEMILEKHR